MKTNRRILVVDDDPVVGKSFERVLSTKGYAVINCSNGKDALAKLQNEEYDAVFTDLKMSGMDGLEVAAKVKANQPWMPVVIVTGYATPEAEIKAASFGVHNFVQKPLSPEMIEFMAEDAMNEKMAVANLLDAKVELDKMPAIESPLVQVQNTNFLLNIALFLAAPFIGLLYALALPFVGMGLLASIAFKAAMKNDRIRFAGTMIAAPFIGLAFAVVMPIAGLITLCYMGANSVFSE
jgi:CheY-like chemotaxis protein